MLKKLSEDKQNEILKVGVREFADRGFDNVSMSSIAAKAGISVGVLYKYYADKDAFFEACVKRSVLALENAIEAISSKDYSLEMYIRELICAASGNTEENGDFVRLYHRITCAGNEKQTGILASEIEGLTSRLYTEVADKAQKEGMLRADIEPSFIAMFLDNLIMMIQFTANCPYYHERYRLYRQNDPENETDIMAGQLYKFIETAIGLDVKK